MPKRFDPEYVKQLEEEGMSPTDALREACTTMSGAYEKADGTIHAWQTICNKLFYKETLPESPEAIKGKKATESSLLDFLKRQFPEDEVTAENIDTFVDKWMALPDESRLRE